MKVGQERFSDINALLNERLEAKKHLVAVHRGSWGGNIIQNTVGAYIAAERMGADMVESDVNCTTDGVLYSFHDGHEFDVLGTLKNIKEMSSFEVEANLPLNSVHLRCKTPVSKLADVLEWLPEKMLVNIDRAWDIFPKVLEELDRHPKALQRVVLKAPLRGKHAGVDVEDAWKALEEHPTKYMFMPICYSLDDVKEALTHKDINIVGCEIIAFHDTDELYQDEAVAYIHDHGFYAWVNAIQLGDYKRDPLYGPLDDDISVLKDPALGWGKLFEKKIDIIQTDWPALLSTYRDQVLGKK